MIKKLVPLILIALVTSCAHMQGSGTCCNKPCCSKEVKKCPYSGKEKAKKSSCCNKEKK